MLDIKWIRKNPEQFDDAMKKRGIEVRATEIIKLDEEKRNLETKIQELQSKRNQIAKEVAVAKKNNQNADQLFAESKEINTALQKLEEEFNHDKKIEEFLSFIPNIPDVLVPLGADEKDNVEIEKWGELPKFDFAPKQHFEIGEQLKMLDFEQSTIISGARFSTLTKDLAKLERALSNFMLDVALQNGYIEVSPPNLVKSDSMFGSGQLPKFAKEAFKTEDDYWLIPTAEVPLVNLVAKKILSQKELPIRFTAYTPCFRSEAGAAGKDTRGMIRQHQFKKVELVSITDQESSNDEHERMTKVACEILKKLELPFRKILLCTGDMGFASQKTYDLEVWLPGQNQYREISSCSNCGDFQARRLNSKYKNDKDGKNYFTHTLNGSSLAVGRTIIAILENYQNKDGSVRIPKALISYMNGQEVIKFQN